MKKGALAEFGGGIVEGFARRCAGVGEEEEGRKGCGGAVEGLDGDCETWGSLRGVEGRGVDVGIEEAPGGTVDA